MSISYPNLQARAHIELLRATVAAHDEELEAEKTKLKQTIQESTEAASRFGMADRLKASFSRYVKKCVMLRESLLGVAVSQAAFSNSANSLSSVNKQLTMQNKQYLEAIEDLSGRLANGTPRPDYESEQLRDAKAWLDMEVPVSKPAVWQSCLPS